MMRKSKRQIKPKTVFDPSETTSSMDINKDEKEIEESTLLHSAQSVPDINPWDVTNFESFVFYECPECNHKSQDCTTFARHAVLNHHDKASDFLDRMVKEGNLSYDNIASSKKISTPKKKLAHNNKYQSSSDGDNDKENKLRKEPDELQCYVCGERNSVKTKIMDHIRDTHFQDVKNSMFGRPREFQCHECRFMFATPGGLGLHLCGILPPRWSGDYIGAKKCTDCGKTYKKRYDLLAHIAKVHKKAKNFACAHCDYRAAVPFLLTKHIRRMHNDQERSHLCQECGSMFQEKTHLMSHIAYVHKLSKEDSFCYTCGLTIKTAMGMKKHVKEIHGKDLNKVESSDLTKPYKCGACSEEFEQSDELYNHLKKNHEDQRKLSTVDKPVVKYKFACPHCSKLVSNRYSLEHHINKFHEMVKRYSCTVCPDAFFDSQSLKKHEDKHKGINQHECPVCQKIFNTKGLCSRHIKSVHEKEKQYACKSCEFKTFHAYSLTAHVQQVHEKYKPNKCDFCEEAFFYKRDLEKHYTKIHQVTTVVTYAVIDN